MTYKWREDNDIGDPDSQKAEGLDARRVCDDKQPKDKTLSAFQVGDMGRSKFSGSHND